MVFIVSLAALLVPAYAGRMELRGVWVSSVYNLDYPSSASLSPSQLAAEADKIVSAARENGMNAVFLQVRPCADALYPSAVFPRSRFIADNGFDALQYFIAAAHDSGIELHAWINPYRITVGRSFASLDEALAALPDGHPARLQPECAVLYDGNLYFDPGMPASRELIIAGVTEILENYDVDGIHFDDYFYPGTDFDDGASFALYGQDHNDLGDYRRECVNALIREVYTCVKLRKPAADFGVSPFGIWANASQEPRGSRTAGLQAYHSHYADALTWIREGVVDYLAPQLYWHIGSSEADFAELADWWSRAVSGSGVKLYIGMAAYRSAEATEGIWYGADELCRQLELTAMYPEICGAIFFRHGSIEGNSALKEAISARMNAEKERFLMRFADIGQGLELISPVASCRAAAGESIELECRAAADASVTVLWRGQRIAAARSIDGRVRTELFSASPGDYGPPVFISERGGVIFIDIPAINLEFTDTVNPVSITSIFENDENGAHTVTFMTEPCGVRAELHENLLHLTFSPCRTAVLFESDFFSNMELSREDGRITYHFLLPERASAYDYGLEWLDDRVILHISKADR